MEERCPDAWMLNITNPMTALTRTVCRETNVKTVGLCHEVGGFCMDLAIAFRQPHTAVRPVITGVNHFPVITELEIDGKDGFAMLAEMVDELGGLAALAPKPGQHRKRSRSPNSTSVAGTCSSSRCSTDGGRCSAPTTGTWPSSCRRC